MAEVAVESRIEQKHYDSLLFDDVKNIDADQDYWFKLRGENINPLIDAATPLIGMALRVRSMSACEHIGIIYKHAVEEVKATEVELAEAGYEHAVILAFRYIFCSFIDEMVMSTSWGADSVWAEHSLLTRFHNETWGGEKVFTILSRLENEPSRYKDLLEFIYLCLSLGFEGRYRVMPHGREEYERIINRLFLMLQRLEDKEPQDLTRATDHVVSTKYRLSKQVPVWGVFGVFFAIWVGFFIMYSILLHSKSMSVLDQLTQVLK
ncbi:type IVB secretion system protein IcmH/DotU [Halodesulfovibrio aestuarii]|uniref:type IVB secretion system protein IcmH/DotU n=1 Tax=Halodesulfovibrio aestuarii TaxID=126333 RepID=UPI000421153B